jgi:hypothetical protein
MFRLRPQNASSRPVIMISFLFLFLIFELGIFSCILCVYLGALYSFNDISIICKKKKKTFCMFVEL